MAAPRKPVKPGRYEKLVARYPGGRPALNVALAALAYDLGVAVLARKAKARPGR